MAKLYAVRPDPHPISQDPMNLRRPTLPLLVFFSLLVGAFVGIGLRGVYPKPKDPSCHDATRVITNNTSGDWIRCEHPDHVLVERNIGYGMALVSCSCPAEDKNGPTVELTDDEKKTLEDMIDAGEELTPPMKDPP